MNKSKKPQILKISVIASLFIITPYIPTMFKSSYLYFIFNLLVIALVAEAGLLSFFSEYHENKNDANLTFTSSKPVVVVNYSFTAKNNRKSTEIKEILQLKMVEQCSSKNMVVLESVKVSEVKEIKEILKPYERCSWEKIVVHESLKVSEVKKIKEICKAKVVERCSSEKIVILRSAKVSEVKKSPSVSCIFFIGKPPVMVEEDQDESEEDEATSRQELFTKTEMFIGNFHKQLKLQRQVSWNRTHPN